MSNSKIAPLPIPGALPRPVTPPPRQTFTLESPTGKRSPDFAQFQALASVFDEMTNEERAEFIEFAFVFRSMGPAARARLLAIAIDAVFP